MLGLVASLLAGSIMPIFSFSLSQMIDALNIENFRSVADQKDQAETWILVLTATGVVLLFIFYF